jgi:hypothetical protein
MGGCYEMSESKRETRKALKAKLAFLRGIAGADRQAYFEAGFPLAGWRGTHSVQRDRKKEASRKTCRGHHSRRDDY